MRNPAASIAAVDLEICFPKKKKNKLYSKRLLFPPVEKKVALEKLVNALSFLQNCENTEAASLLILDFPRWLSSH